MTPDAATLPTGGPARAERSSEAGRLPAAGEPLVHTRELSKIYRVGDSRIAALNRVNLTIERGTFTAVVGTSGSGKSTLLNMLAGLERPTAGEIHVAGQPLHTYNESQLVTYRREQVGFIFQSFNLIPSLTAIENVALPLSFRGIPKAARERQARAILVQLGLAKHLSHRPGQLSGGQQQRVGIARAMAVRPTLVFADEPTGNLDSRTAEATLNLFRTVIRRFGQTWVMVTHDAHLASFADTIVSIGDGRITGITETEHHPRNQRTPECPDKKVDR
ncbi:ABC transporter ATP-binding protein [Enemella sp. A6]|uniref:ABC transporter ATP-binding protein n=1 Tax=Enemella sp. A6 TaxID=3440152 RepID=UPI003EC0985F